MVVKSLDIQQLENGKESSEIPDYRRNGDSCCTYTNTSSYANTPTRNTNETRQSRKFRTIFTKNSSNDAEPKISITECPNILSDEFKDYEPYDFCTSEKPTSYCDSLIHLLKCSIGTGILALPSAFKIVGYGIGILGVFVMSIFYLYCIHLLVSSEYRLCKRKRIANMTYAQTVHAAFEDGPPKLRWLADTGKFFANFFFMVYESGGCAIYTIFIAENLKNLLDYYSGDVYNVQTIIVYLLILLIPLCWVRNLKLFAPLSAIANIIILVCFGIVFWYVFREVPSFENRRATTANIEKLPSYLNTILYALACTGIVMPLKNDMKKPEQFASFCGVLNAAMVPIALLYAVFGFFGYLKYGDAILGSITLNLPKDELLAQSIRALYSLSIAVSYYLCYYVVFDIVWINYLKVKFKDNNLFWEYVIRTVIPIVIFLMAYAIPNLNVVISLVGALGISTTSLSIPIVVHTLVFWDYHETNFEFYKFLIKNSVLFFISIFIFVTGLTDSITDIIKIYA